MRRMVSLFGTLTVMVIFLSGCSKAWGYLPDIQVEEINREIFVGEEAEVNAQIVASISAIGDDLTEKQMEQAGEQLDEKTQEFRETYSLEFEIPEESADILEWVEQGKTVKGVAPGSGVVNVRFADHGEEDPDKDKRDGGTVSITITVKEILPESITVSDTEITLTEGDEKETTAEVMPENAGNREVTYTSSNEEAVTVDGNGKVKAVAPGDAEITVTAKGDESVKETIKVTVEAIPEPDPEPATTTNSGSGSSSGKPSSDGSSGTTSKGSGSSGNSGKSSGGSSSSKGSSGSSGGSSENSGGGSDSGTFVGGSIGDKWYDGDDYNKAIDDRKKEDADNGVIGNIWD